MTNMRAKLRLDTVLKNTSGETLNFYAVAASKYPEDGSDENNTYAKFSPSARCEIFVANPALFGKFTPGEEYYVDFTLAPTETAKAAA